MTINIGGVSNDIQYIFNESYYIIADGNSSDGGRGVGGSDDNMNNVNGGNNVNSGNSNIEVDENVGGGEDGVAVFSVVAVALEKYPVK
ncbi:5979_t:CDS:2 [Entrophospora sp. SA101]|nr:5979_t:CDS:2 [Entrophospora sp. SA101]CAJ0847373.1 13964_t:CDS:2 [Entrophospora sp. SA101]